MTILEARQKAFGWLKEDPYQPTTPQYDRLIDERTGIITRILLLPYQSGMPKGVYSVGAKVANANRLGSWPADRVAGGHTFDFETARYGAIGEAIERYCGNFVSKNLLHGSFKQLSGSGLNAVDPCSLVLYTDKQYRIPGFPFVPFTRELEVNWVQGVSLITGEPIYVPASIVYVNYIFGERSNEPATNFHAFAGLACGPSMERAIISGLLEVLERDATVMWWLADGNIPLIDLQSCPELNALLDPGPGRNVEWYIAYIPSDFGIPVIGALLVDRDDEVAGMGFACRHSAYEATLKAVGEAVQLHTIAWGIKNPSGVSWRAMQEGIIHSGALKPFKADLTYLDSFRPDFRDVTDLAHHSQIYLDRRMWAHLDRVTNIKNFIRMEDVKSPTPGSLDGYLSIMKHAGFDVICVDVTTPDVREVGLRVVRVIVPGLIPNAPGGLPFIGGRLLSMPATLGMRDRVLTEEELNYAPLPHS